jgi:hypothetical protein
MILNLSKSEVAALLLNLSIFWHAGVFVHLASRSYDLAALIRVPVLAPLKTLSLIFVRFSLFDGQVPKSYLPIEETKPHKN